MTLEPNAIKVTMLFPLFANDGQAFPPEVWDWWLDEIVALGSYHEFETRGLWKGQFERHRCVKLVITDEKELLKWRHSCGRRVRGSGRKLCTSRRNACTSSSYDTCAPSGGTCTLNENLSCNLWR